MSGGGLEQPEWQIRDWNAGLGLLSAEVLQWPCEASGAKGICYQPFFPHKEWMAPAISLGEVIPSHRRPEFGTSFEGSRPAYNPHSALKEPWRSSLEREDPLADPPYSAISETQSFYVGH